MFDKNPVSERPASERRRTQRVILNVPITVARVPGPTKGKDGNTAPAFDEDSFTLVVNAHGALIILAAKVERGEILRMTNQRTRAERLCKVIYVGASVEGKAQMGVEFLMPSPDFWGVAFPPKDWAPAVEPSQGSSIRITKSAKT